jgi:assimilatory nitrate reductase catalytic subunit
VAAAVRTTCPYCGVGCGVLAPSGERGAQVAGDPEHPANRGRLCAKGLALGDTEGLEGRLLTPRLNGGPADWESALAFVAAGLSSAIREHGPDSVAFYVSGQLLTEDYYVANKLMKGFIGSANIDTNSRLCMASAVAAHQRAFGEDLVPGCYEDFELADLIVLVGSNAAWCHPVLFRRIADEKERRPQLRIVVIDPRRTATCEIADLHLPIRPGSDAWLFNGLLRHLHRETPAPCSPAEGLAEALRAAADCDDPAHVAQACGVDAGRLSVFYRWFATTPRTVTAFSQGINQSSSGTDKANAILNCHLLTGRIGTPGAGPFSLTGQPNAMGGREVGGMANMLAAHMQLGDPAHASLVQGFWKSPRIASRPGLKAVELFEAVRAERIRAIWIMGTNPVASLPHADRVRAALARCPLVVVSDCVEHTDTTQLAHVLLPAAAWGEKSGTVTNSERRISRQRAFLAPPGESRPDWWIISQVARRMGHGAAFDYQEPAQIFLEHAQLSGIDNQGERAFNISGLSAAGSAGYESLNPIQWPVTTQQPQGTARLADLTLFSASRRARFVSVVPRGPAQLREEEYPLVMNTGRTRDQWHTMTRTGRAPRLCEHTPEPFVDVHGQDALLHGLREGELARLQTRCGAMIARVVVSGSCARGTAFVPIHWTDTHSSDARVGTLIDAVVDPVSGEPEFKHTPVRVEPFVVDWYGFLLSARSLAQPSVTWWTKVQGERVTRYEIAGRGVPVDWSAWARTLLGLCDGGADFVEYSDAGAGTYRAAFFEAGRLSDYVCVGRAARLPERSRLAGRFDGIPVPDAERLALLADTPGGARAAHGSLLCACHGVSRERIVSAVRAGEVQDARSIGMRFRAGTGCGSCLPEIRALLRQTCP